MGATVTTLPEVWHRGCLCVCMGEEGNGGHSDYFT